MNARLEAIKYHHNIVDEPNMWLVKGSYDSPELTYFYSYGYKTKKKALEKGNLILAAIIGNAID